MLQGRTTTTNQVVAGAAWAATVWAFIIAAALMLADHWKVGILTAEIGCGLSAYAAVRHLRCYAAGICEKIDELGLEGDVRRLAGQNVTGFPRPRQRSDIQRSDI